MVSQNDVKQLATRLFPATISDSPRVLDVFDNAEIDKKHLCVSLDWLAERHGLGERNDSYIENATQLGSQVAREALDRGGLTPRDVDHIIFVSSTGLATPSIDALLANRLDFRADVRRTPLWGLGCAGGAVGLSRARDFALADPRARVLLVALELCSFTFQPSDDSKRNLIATAIFADGAAAAVVEGSLAAKRSRGGYRPLEMVGSHSVFWKNTLDVMGWSIYDDGLHVVFSRDIPSIVRESVRPSLVPFLERQGLSLDDVHHLVAHPGGVKVLRAYAGALGIDAERLRHARDVLREYGNMSSPSCLFVLERFLAAGDIAPGERALVTALGPGFSAEYVLMKGVA